MTGPGMAPDVVWWDAPRSADEALSAHAVARLGAGRVVTGRVCPRCGAGDHGRPWLRHGTTSVHVSVARSGPYLVTALGETPVGVDVESVAAVGRGWRPELVCTAAELATAPATPEARARLWVAKEAILKQLGTGLATPMTEVQLAAYVVLPIDAPTGYVAAVCTGRAGSASS